VTTFDASPNSMKELERSLRNEEGIIRFYPLKLKSVFDKCRDTTYRNPYLKID
jgi:ribosomal protein S6